MGKVYFITRTFPGISGTGGGALIRLGQVETFRNNGLDTWIVAPNLSSDKSICNEEDKMLLFPFNTKKHLLYSLFDKLGLIEDYSADWISNSLKGLASIVKENDTVFCTSGGELGSVILGSKLKKLTGCSFVINFHDPVLNAKAFGKKVRLKGSRFFHVGRDKTEAKYLQNVDYIYTSSDVYRLSLSEKYPGLKDRIKNVYFGYINEFNWINIDEPKIKNPLRIAYGGSMGKEQSPEILAKAVAEMDDVCAYFFGDISSNEYLKNPVRNVQIMEYLPYDEYLLFLKENIDMTFMSLDGDLSHFCVPSKLFEYINLEIPMIAAVAGDAARIIADNKFGLTCDYDEVAVRNAIGQLAKIENYKLSWQSLRREKSSWAMSKQLEILVKQLKELTNS